ncbi:MAG: cupin domain-containing protein [Chloroflexi bacterium]|nr:cupin domain-containing protein [Chloroflexota bacterium]
MAVTYDRIYADEDGESHFETVEVALKEVDYAPPADPVYLSELEAATKVGVLMVSPGPAGDWHPTPVTQYLVVVSGEAEITVSDGEKRRFKPGQVFLTADKTGKGHYSENVSSEPLVLMVIHLPD